MKCSETWLRQWANPNLNVRELSQALTMAGFEVESISPVAGVFSNVVVGEILAIEKHPNATRLQCCQVSVNGAHQLHIVCGATNIQVGMRVPVAMVGAQLPNNIEIKRSTIRGVTSEGMLCSAAELEINHLLDEHSGILALAKDAPLGADVYEYLNLKDHILDISITPNRGDCLSIKGMSREIAAISQSSWTPLPIPRIQPQITDSLNVEVLAPQACSYYVGRVISNISLSAETPLWMVECLRRSAIRAIHPVVDVVNYVMLELGQPMHAFDLAHIQGGICVRYAKEGECLNLLDQSTHFLHADTLVIADDTKALAIAGVMGGMSSAVSQQTHAIFLESAYFSPMEIAKQRQYYALNSDAAFRFERGIDPKLQKEALERATSLLLEIVGGQAGPIIEQEHKQSHPVAKQICLPLCAVEKILGIAISQEEIEAIFSRLYFSFAWQESMESWQVEVPSYRHDLSLAEDLIEEIARLHGYQHIPLKHSKVSLELRHDIKQADDYQRFRQQLSQLAYHETISYSFVDKDLQLALNPGEAVIELLNPVASNMRAMRTNLWPGLLQSLMHNLSRQQHRIRLYEIGTCFVQKATQIIHSKRIGGIISGLAYPQQWAIKAVPVDFFDLKADVTALLYPVAKPSEWVFRSSTHQALHPGQSADIFINNQLIGSMGALHPNLVQQFELNDAVLLFELDLDLLAFHEQFGSKKYQDVSKFPEIRRDLALLVNETIPAEEIQATICAFAGDWLKEVCIFDVYTGKGISSGLKSIALSIFLQHPSRTLVDEEIAEIMNRVVAKLKGNLGAELRS